MGDDVTSRERTLDTSPDATITELLRTADPDVIVSGGSTWISCWNDTAFAVSSSTWGTGKVWNDRYRTVADLPAPGEGATLHHRCWTQMDPEWLLARLREEQTLERRDLERQWQPIAAQRHGEALRHQQATDPERLFDETTVDTLEALGACIDLHAASSCRFIVGETLWDATRYDSMTIVLAGRTRRGSLRLVGIAQTWVVAVVAKELTGRDELPPPVVGSTVRRSPHLWTVVGDVDGRQELAQHRDQADVDVVQRTLGRTVEDVVKACELGPESPAPRSRPWWRRWLDRA